MNLDISLSLTKSDIYALRQGLQDFNLRKVPSLVDLPSEEFVVVMRENGRIVAGTVCELHWNYLYFDAVWTHESTRGKGYGSLVMQASESYAAEQGVRNAYLMTTSFQARPFYEKIGYTRFGFQADRPLGHTLHYMKKHNLATQPIDPRITVEAPPSDHSMTVIDTGLLNDIETVAPLHNQKLAIFLRDDEGKILGGIFGGMFWNWYDVHLFWLSDTVRGQGWGKAILAEAESVARQHGCIGIVCDTASFQAFDFYHAQGFEVIGTLENRPPQHESRFIQKRF